MSGKIIYLEGFRNKKEPKSDDLNELLIKAHKLRGRIPKSDEMVWQDFGNLKGLFETRLNELLLDNRFIGANIFLCSSYIAILLAKFATKNPESWYATDYAIKGYESRDPFVLQNGADVCFILCTLYPERCNRRSMKKSDYVSLGSGLYHRFYNQTGREIGYYMGDLFELMSEVTAECVKRL